MYSEFKFLNTIGFLYKYISASKRFENIKKFNFKQKQF
jgi:hypothetical protein